MVYLAYIKLDEHLRLHEHNNLASVSSTTLTLLKLKNSYNVIEIFNFSKNFTVNI